MFNIQTIHPNISVITFTGEFRVEDWQHYERAYRELYRIHTRGVVVFDLRALSMDIPNIIDFITLKKKLLLSLKAKTCQMLFAAIIVTEYDFMSELVLSIAKLSGQASLFYSCHNIKEAANIASRLVCIINGRRTASCGESNGGGGALKWRDISTGSIFALLIVSFLRHVRHFIKK